MSLPALTLAAVAILGGLCAVGCADGTEGDSGVDSAAQDARVASQMAWDSKRIVFLVDIPLRSEETSTWLYSSRDARGLSSCAIQHEKQAAPPRIQPNTAYDVIHVSPPDAQLEGVRLQVQAADSGAGQGSPELLTIQCVTSFAEPMTFGAVRALLMNRVDVRER